ncbi:e3 ubiquitin-protein ligase fancl [Citrus sinensis]|uniref:E3 ubiquitin-protein ligase fancl n=1 Tax=Citrus sinensis TaxID=2711 RepID=A0ACB8J5A3_CITSI|nr:e3 ubiquitin-protein ligase fancl [Citrus sinensis]
MVQYPIEDTWLLHFELVTLADYRWSRVDAENRPIPRHLAARSTQRLKCSDYYVGCVFVVASRQPIEEVGWEHLDVPYIFNLKWSRKSRLKDLLQQFREHLEKLQEIWNILDEIDKSLWVIDLKNPSRANVCRQINLGYNCIIMLSIHIDDPSSLPECRFMGSDPMVNSLRKTWQRNSKRWNKDKPFVENVANLLETQLPRPPEHENNYQQVECGICYAQFLPIDEELGAKSGGGTDYTCDNSSCSKAFHSVCLGDWLRSITTTRQTCAVHMVHTAQRNTDLFAICYCDKSWELSYDVLFGNCPYCSEPVAVKISIARKISARSTSSRPGGLLVRLLLQRFLRTQTSQSTPVVFPAQTFRRSSQISRPPLNPSFPLFSRRYGTLTAALWFWGKRGCRGSVRFCVLRHSSGESVAVVPRFSGWGACLANCRRPGLLASRPLAGMTLCLLREVGLADDVLVDERDTSAPVPPRTRLLRNTPVRGTLLSDICSPRLVSSTYFSQTITVSLVLNDSGI